MACVSTMHQYFSDMTYINFSLIKSRSYNGPTITILDFVQLLIQTSISNSVEIC